VDGVEKLMQKDSNLTGKS